MPQGRGDEAHRIGRQADPADGDQDRRRRRQRVRAARGRRAAHAHAGRAARVLQGRRRHREHLDRRRLAAQRRPRATSTRTASCTSSAARRTSSSAAATTCTRPTSRAVLLEHPDVQEAAVVGMPAPRARRGHRRLRGPARPTPRVDADELQAFCADRLADYKRPRQVHFVDELPRNATGKVMKHLLGDDAAGTTSRKSS